MIAATLAPLAPADRITALADAGSFVADPPAGASPDLARFGVVAREDDGIVTGRARIAGREVLVAAQDERFLRGAAGPRHARALAALFAHARAAPQRPVVLLLASGGVRLHEANAAELELARALKAAVDARAAGVPVVAIATGDVYGGASVLACACDRLALLPSTRLGLSGPAVVEIARGRGELDARDAEAVDAIYGAPARAAAGIADLVEDDVATLVAWIDMAIRAAEPFEARVRARHARVLTRLGSVPVASPSWIEPGLQGAFVLRAVGGAMGASEAAGIDTALLAALDGGRMRSVLLVEDSHGHEVSVAAERAGLSLVLANHACVLGLLRSRGRGVATHLAGIGHSAAFFAHGLQAQRIEADAGARVVAMDAPGMARVLKLDPARLAALLEDDPLLGQPARHFAALGGLTIAPAAV